MEMLIVGFKEEAIPLLLRHSLSFLVPFLIFTLLLFKWRDSSSRTLKSLPPSPPKLPIIGNLHQLGSITQRSLKSLAQKYGPVMLLHLGSKPVLIVSSANAAQEVLKTHDLIFSDRPKPSFARRLLYNFRDITFSSYGEYWRQVRSICVLQLLSNKRIRSYRSVREDEISLMLEKVRKSCSSSSAILIGEILATLANNTVSRITVGKSYSEEKDGTKFKGLFQDLSMFIGVFNVGDYIPWLGWINHLNGLEAKVNRFAKELDEYFENIIEEGMKRLQEKRVVSSDGEGKEDKEQQTLVDLLLQLQKENGVTGFALDRESIKAIILDMFVGGTETTSSLLEWTIAELLKNTNAMTELQNEVRNFSRCNSDQITEDDLEKLPYLKAVIKEALRMHPPVPLLAPRESRKDVKMMGYDIAASTQVFINAWAIGREPSLWEDADKFRPERFLNSSIDFTGQHFEFIPFGSGRRSCPGSGFSLVIVELGLANLILNFNFALASGARPEELDMTEAPGFITHRKIPLLLVASLPH